MVQRRRNGKDIYKAKVVLVGDSSVGKTSILLRYDGQGFTSCLSATLQASFLETTIRCDNQDISLNIWDTAGQERYRSMVYSQEMNEKLQLRLYVRNSVAAIFVFDLSRYDTFRNLQYWIEDVERSSSGNVLKYIVGNKSDLADDRVVSESEARDFAKKHDGVFFETSALNGSGIEGTIRSIAKDLLQLRDIQQGENGVDLETTGNNRSSSARESRSCCNIL